MLLHKTVCCWHTHTYTHSQPTKRELMCCVSAGLMGVLPCAGFIRLLWAWGTCWMCLAAPLHCLTTPLAGPHLRVHLHRRNPLIGRLLHGWVIFWQTVRPPVKWVSQSEPKVILSRVTPNQIFAFSQNRTAEFWRENYCPRLVAVVFPKWLTAVPDHINSAATGVFRSLSKRFLNSDFLLQVPFHLKSLFFNSTRLHPCLTLRLDRGDASNNLIEMDQFPANPYIYYIHI